MLAKWLGLRLGVEDIDALSIWGLVWVSWWRSLLRVGWWWVRRMGGWRIPVMLRLVRSRLVPLIWRARRRGIVVVSRRQVCRGRVIGAAAAGMFVRLPSPLWLLARVARVAGVTGVTRVTRVARVARFARVAGVAGITGVARIGMTTILRRRLLTPLRIAVAVTVTVVAWVHGVRSPSFAT